MSDSPLAPEVGDATCRPRACRVALAAVVAVIVISGCTSGRGSNHATGRPTTSEAANSSERTTTSTANHRTIACGPWEPEPTEVESRHPAQRAIGPPTVVMDSAQQAELEAHFGKRLNAVWTGRARLGEGRSTMIAASGITGADRAWARSIPSAYGHVELVDAEYSADDLKAFAARLRTAIPNWHLPSKYLPPPPDERVETILHPPSTTTIPIPKSVWPKGLFRVVAPYPRQDGTEEFGENIVSISVLECSPKLVAQAVQIADAKAVPLKAIRIVETQWDRR